MLLQRYDQTAPNGTGTEVCTINTGVYMQEAIPKFIQSDMRETGNKTGVALVDVAMPAD